MVRWLISILIHIGANALALWIADMVLDGFTIEYWSGFITAVLIFTVIEVIASPILTRMAMRSVTALRGSVALVATFIGLLVTNLFDGLSIDGVDTWIFATIIVWLGGLVAGLLLPVFLVKKAVDENN